MKYSNQDIDEAITASFELPEKASDGKCIGDELYPDTFGWQIDHYECECDRCHSMGKTCRVEFPDEPGEWDYCQDCWKVLSERGAFDGLWI